MTPIAPTPTTIDGKEFHLTTFPATVGREIIMQYPTSALPKVGDYQTNHALMLKVMGYVGVQIEGRDGLLMLSTEALVNNHVAKPETLIKLEWAMMTHNFDFFKDGRASGFLDLIAQKAEASITQMLTSLLARSSGKS